MATSTSDQRSRPEAPELSRGLLDTSVVIDIDAIDDAVLPAETAISAVTLAELAAGPHATRDKRERGRRQDRLQWAAAQWDPLPFDADAARAYGRMAATFSGAGRSSRRHVADLLIAATALAHGLPLYTRNAADLRGLAALIEINAV